MVKKQKTSQKKKKKNRKRFLKVTQVFLLPKAIELRKKLGYNHGDIMVREQTSIAEEIIKLFPHEKIGLNKKFNNRKSDIWFKNHNFIIEVDEENHENYDS